MYPCRPIDRFVILCLLLGLLSACTPSGTGGLPEGPTPIPTLIPATEPGSALGATVQPEFVIQSYPARQPSAALGEPLYQEHCAGCHGADGNGVVAGARNFNDLDYMRGETPASFYAAITEGRGDMPAFRDRLNSDERWDLVFYVWQFSTDAQTVALGHDIYEANCAACHGEDGTGEVLGAADFTDLSLVDSHAPRDFYLAVTQGVGSMPAWQGRLSQEERWAVINYLRTFSYDPSLAAEEVAEGEDGEETEETEPTAQPTSTPAAVCEPYLGEENPFEWDDAQAIAAGEVIYEQSCAMCHADDGSGALANTPDLTDAEAQSELREETGEWLCIVAEGKDTMPGWKETLTTDEIWQVLTFIGSLSD